VTGDDLRAAGIRPGPALGRILHTLLDWVLDDPTRNAFPTLIEMARTLSQET
jgi:tRNA nucleotidyltransferase (CCA-adding enzyme)